MHCKAIDDDGLLKSLTTFAALEEGDVTLHLAIAYEIFILASDKVKVADANIHFIDCLEGFDWLLVFVHIDPRIGFH